MVGASKGQAKGTQPTAGEPHTWVAIELDFSANMTIPAFKGCLWSDPGSIWVETDINQHRKTHQHTQPHNIQKCNF